MPKFYKRGTPEDPLLARSARDIRTEISFPQNHDALLAEFGEYTLHDLLNGEVELESEQGSLFRCYLIRDEDERRVVVDDYHPEEDADVKVDGFGNILGDIDDPEIP